MFEKSLKVVAENNLSHELTPGGAGGGGAARPTHTTFNSVGELKMPRMTHHDTVVAAVPRRTYANAHAYHINSISVNSDGETFISSDDLRINLWNLNIQDQSFNIVDIKPTNMEELTEVITAAEFHPQSCNWFMYASSKGTIKLADMRESALCDQHAKREYVKSTLIEADIVQNLNKRKIRPQGRSSQKSSRQSPMSAFHSMDGTYSQETTLRSRSGMSIWNDRPSKPFQFTSTSGLVSAILTRMIVSLISSKSCSVGMVAT